MRIEESLNMRFDESPPPKSSPLVDDDIIESAIVYTCWIEKMESVQEMSGCGDNQKVKYIAGSFIGKALMWWNS
ncbi:hypothetical protein Tco_0129665 [Tanacetum coccineum]